MNSLQELRKRHLQSLFSNFQVKKVQDEVYKVILNSGFDVILELSVNFPEISPKITLSEYTHPKFTPNYQIRNWNFHSSLVGILTDIEKEFLLQPPLKTSPVKVSPSTAHLTSGHSVTVDRNLDLQELQQLDTDLLAFDDYFDDLEIVKRKQELVETLFLQNYNLALMNKEKEKEYFKKVQEYQELFVMQGEYRKEFDSKIYDFQNKVLRLSPGELRKILIQIIRKLEVESEEMITQFKEKTVEMGMDVFLREFKGIRKNLHLNQARLERLNLREQ